MSTNAVTAEESSRFVTTKLHKLHYNEAGSGHPIVMLHGSGPMLAHFRVLAFDMPGWGQTEHLDPAEPFDHVEALVLALDELGIERATLVGNSMGGMTSIRMAIEHPGRVAHLIPMGAPAPGLNVFTPGGGLSEGLKVLTEAYEDPSPANFKRLVSIMAYDQAFATDQLAEERSRNALERPENLRIWNRFVQSGFIAEYTAMVGPLAGITAPTLVVHGHDDRTVNIEHSLRLVAAIPDARLVIFNRCGHWAQLEHAAEFNRLVEQFVRNH